MPPSVNHYLGWRGIIKNKKPMAVSYETTIAKKYKKTFINHIKEEVAKQKWTLIPNKEQHFYVDMIFYFDRIDKDASNYDKCLLDAITDTQLIWMDDNVVCNRVNRIYYDSENPRIELEIYPCDYIGIFNNDKQLDEFKSTCIGCTRYKRNCSILKKAIEGRIQEEIQNNQCSKFTPIKKG